MPAAFSDRTSEPKPIWRTIEAISEKSPNPSMDLADIRRFVALTSEFPAETHVIVKAVQNSWDLSESFVSLIARVEV